MSRKKNKKSFSSNLESLFQERMFEDNAQDSISMIEENETFVKAKGQAATKKKGKTTSKKAPAKKNKTNKKSFSSNLERFFKNSIDGVLDGVVTEVKRNVVGKGNKKAIGIDLLIQRTTEDNPAKGAPKQQPQTKRVTVVLDTEKVAELKRIAREEKRRLHQIIGELVQDYLDGKV